MILSGRGSGSHTWVMGQVGHADSKMTLDVYAQLEQRVDRQHGTSFDLLIRRAREELRRVAQSLDDGSPDPEEVPSSSSVGHGPEDATAAAFSVVTGVAGCLRLVRFSLQKTHFRLE